MPSPINRPMSPADQARLSSRDRTRHAEWRASTADGRSGRRGRTLRSPATLRLPRWSLTLTRPAGNGRPMWPIAEPRGAE